MGYGLNSTGSVMVGDTATLESTGSGKTIQVGGEWEGTGILSGTGTVTANEGEVTVNDMGTLSAGDATDATGTLKIGTSLVKTNLTLQDEATLKVTVDTTTTSKVAVTGTTTVGSADEDILKVDLTDTDDIADAVILSATTLTVNSNLANTEFSLNGTSLDDLNAASRTTINADVTKSGNDLVLGISTTYDNNRMVTWNSGVGGDWNTATQNWTIGNNNPTAYFDGDHVVFDSIPGGDINIASGTTRTASQMDVNTGAWTFNGNLTIDADTWDDGTVANAVVKTGALTIANGASATLNGINAIAGGIANAGTLTLKTEGSSGDAAIDNAGTLVAEFAGTLASVISGAGEIRKTGNGVLTVTGDSSAYTGTFTQSAGEISLADTAKIGGAFTQSAGTLASASGATLGAATFEGSVTPTGTLNVTSASFAGATVDLSDGRIVATGAVAFTGNTTIDLGDLTGESTRSYLLMTGSGVTGLDKLTATVTLDGAQRGAFYLSEADTQLNYGLIEGSTSLIWAGTNGANAWNNNIAANTNWFTGDYNTYFKNNDDVIFAADSAHKTVAVAADGVTVGTMAVLDDYSFAGGKITAIGAVTVAADKKLGLSIANGNTPALTAASVDFNGTGALNIAGYTTDESSPHNSSKKSRTVISTTGSGTNQIKNFDPLLVTVAGQASVDFLTASAKLANSGNDVVVETGLSWYSTDSARKAHGTFTVAAGNDFTLGVVLADNTVNLADGWNGKTLTKAGAGALILTADNTYTGGTTVTAGTLQIGNGGTTGSVVGDTLDNAAVVFNRSDAVVYAGNISGSGTLEKKGNDTLTLTGSNTHTGLTTVTAGTLQIGNAGETGGIAGNINTGSEAAVIFNRSNDSTYAGNMSGEGVLEKKGGGTLTLTGANTHSGLTTVSAGTLQIGDGGTTGIIAGAIANHAAVLFNRFDNVTYGGAISGDGSLTQKGVGTLAFTGTLGVKNGAVWTHAGDITIDAGSTLSFNQAADQALSGVLSGNGTLNKVGTNSLAVNGSAILGVVDVDNGALNIAAGATLAAGTIDLASGATLGVDVGSTVSTGTFTNVAGSVINITGYSDASASVTILEAENDITRNYTIKVGSQTLPIGPDIDSYLSVNEDRSDTKKIILDVGLVWNNNNDKDPGDNAQTAHGTFTIASGDPVVIDATLENNRSAAGGAGYQGWDGTTLTKKGAGTLVLSAANTYSGGSDIAAGTLRATNLKALGTGVASVQDDAVLEAKFASLAAGDMTDFAALVGQVDIKNGGAFNLVVDNGYAIDRDIALSAAAAGSTFTFDSPYKTVTLASGKKVDAKGADISLTRNTAFNGTDASVVTTGDFLVAGSLVADGGDLSVTAKEVRFAADSGIAIGANAANDGAAKISVTGDITVAGAASVHIRESLVNLGTGADGSVILESTGGSFSAEDADNFALRDTMFTKYSLDTTSNANALTLLAQARSDDEQEEALIKEVETVTGVDHDSAYTSVHTATDGTFSQSMTSAFGSSTSPGRIAYGDFATYTEANPGTWTWEGALDAVHNGGNPGMTMEGLQNTVYLNQVANGSAKGLTSGDNWVMTGAAVASSVDSTIATVGRVVDLNVSHGMALSKEFLTPTPIVQGGPAYLSLLVNSPRANRVWAGAFGVWEDMGKKDSYAGYNYKAHGFIVGYDRFFGPVALGASFAYAKGDLDEKEISGDGKIHSYSANLYGSYTHCSGFFGFVHGGFTYSDNKLDRVVNSAMNRSKYHTNTWNVGGRVGYQMALTPSFMVTPTMGLEYIHAKNSDFTASGGIYQNYSGVKGESFRAPIDVEASYTAKVGCDSTVTFTAKGGYAYEFRDKGVTGTMSYVGVPGWNPTAIRGVKPGRHSWNVGGGVKFETKRFDAELTYQYTGRKKLDNHQVMATVGLKF